MVLEQTPPARGARRSDPANEPMVDSSPTARGAPDIPTAPPPCNLCGSADTAPVFHNRDSISEEGFDILRCCGCGLLRTDFRGTARDLERYYGPSYYGSRGRRFRPAIESALACFRQSRARLVARAAGRPGRILDLGCGRGLMLGALCAMGWDCIGTETSEELAEAVRKERGVMVLTGLSEALPFEGGSFDTVTSWHSLEHMERPVRMLKEVARLLKPGGTLIVEVPNAASFQARLGGGSWFHFDAPRHLYHFKREELRDILRDLGLTVFRESTLSIEQGPYGMVQSMLNRVTFAPNVLYGLIRRTSTRREGFGTGSSRRVRAAWDLSATVFLALPAGLIGTILELGACIAGRGGVVRILAVKGPRPAGALVIDPTR